MKKVFYIVLGILLMGAGACTERIRLDSPQEEGTVTIDMSVTIPNLATKAVMADNPVIDNIYVAIYGSNHYLNDYVKAFPYDPETKQIVSTYTPVNGVYNLRVTLQATASKRYIHILANGPDHLGFNTKEDELLNNINTSVEITTVDGKIVADGGAYWSYFELPNGTAVLNSDGNWDVAPTASSAFTGIKLVRNFARIKVENNASNFWLDGFHVYRTAAKGSFAMPLQPTEQEAAQENGPKWGEKYLPPSSYAGSAGQSDVVGYIQNTLKYPGHMPMAGDALVESDFIDTAEPKTGDAFYNGAFQYVYESPYMENDWYPYIIVKGRYGSQSATPTYYKIEFSDGENRIPLYRNVDYTITLTAVGKAGESDPKNAQTSNVNVSTMATELSEISDGISALYVLFTEKTFVVPAKRADETDAQYNARRTATFKYQYVKTLPSTYAQASFSDLTSEEGGAAIVESSWTKEQDADEEDANWYDISFLLNPSPASGSSDLVSTFVVTGSTGSGNGSEGTLYRTIRVRVIPVPVMSLSTTVNSGNVNVSMTLPGNLPASIFPLIFKVSDSAGCLNPAGTEMPLEINDSNHTYSFIKTVSRTEYLANQPQTGQPSVISFTMKRINTDASTTIKISNEYFDQNNGPATKQVTF